jgi:predicted RNA-binding Zn-ribbon protein involved in translation (DUF1610 family)
MKCDCPHCGAEMKVPKGADTFTCPSCKAVLGFEPEEGRLTRKQYLGILRKNTAYSTLRTVVAVCFWLQIIVGIFFFISGFVAIAAMSATQAPVSALAKLSMLGVFVLWCAASVAIYQLVCIYIDIGDASIEQAYRMQ